MSLFLALPLLWLCYPLALATAALLLFRAWSWGLAAAATTASCAALISVAGVALAVTLQVAPDRLLPRTVTEASFLRIAQALSAQSLDVAAHASVFLIGSVACFLFARRQRAHALVPVDAGPQVPSVGCGIVE